MLTLHAPGTLGTAARAAGHRRQDGDRVAVRHRRLELGQVADVLVVHVDVHEAAQVAVLGEQPIPEAGVLRVEVREQCADRGARAVHRARAAGRLAQDGWDTHLYRHVYSWAGRSQYRASRGLWRDASSIARPGGRETEGRSGPIDPRPPTPGPRFLSDEGSLPRQAAELDVVD